MRIFVFGSNLMGFHGRGAAKYAADNFGAQDGVAKGMTGNAYAIPTKDLWMRPIPLEDIRESITEFLEFASCHPEFEFEVSAIGCGLADYRPAQIAPMFAYAAPNVQLPKEFTRWLKMYSTPTSTLASLL